MTNNIDRRSFLQFNLSSQKRITHIDPLWPTPEMAELHKADLESEPFVFQLPPPIDPPKRLRATSSLKKLSSINWDVPKTAHLLRRVSTGANYSDIKHFAEIGLDAAIKELLFRLRHKPQIPGEWVNEKIPDFGELSTAQRKEYQILYRKRRKELIEWWQNLILRDEISIREIMTLFWHDHFATNAQKVYFPQAIYEQNDAIRENCVGNFKTLLRRVAFGPAMMIWLDTRKNRKNSPNENFARELMELFTMGVDTYSQDDVVNASKAFTGYSTDGYETNYFFDHKRGDGDYWQAYHDFGRKTFLGKSGYLNGDDIIDIILEQEVVAYFICEKIYKWFIYEVPDENFVNQMATIFRENNYEITPVLEFLFTSEHFYDENFRGAQIPNPVSHTLGLIRKAGHKNTTFPDRYIRQRIEVMGMVLFYPPDVNGWTGHRAWVNSITLPIRKLIATRFVDPKLDRSLKFETNLVELVNDLPDPNNARELVKDLALVYFGLPLSETLENKLVEILMDGAAEYDWDINAAGADYRLKGLLKYMLRLPEAQLI